MSRKRILKHEFVEFIPERLNDGTIYVSVKFATVAHKCCCGCGHEVITPLSPTDWKMTFDGETVSLSPSIGNWSFECRSHYWITRNRVEWSWQWSQEKIDACREYDLRAKKEHFNNEESPVIRDTHACDKESTSKKPKGNLRKKLKKLFS